LLGGLMQLQETKTKSGVPGISAVPIVGRLFSKESVAQDQSELLIALVPHIIRRPEITAENLKGIAVGNQTVVKLSYKPRPAEQTGQQAQPPAAEAVPAGTATSPTGTVISPLATPAPGANPPAPAAPPAQPPVAVPVSPVPAPAAPAKPGNEPPKATVMFAPPQAQTQVGGTVSLNFMVSNAQDFFSAPLTFTFDPRVVRLADVIRGGVLNSDNLPPAFTKNIQNDTGTASVSFSRGFGMSGVNGNGILLTLVFQGVASGSSTVTLPQVLLRNSKAEPIPLQTEKPPEAVITVR
jgi:general secretion pathway protein D